MPEEVRTAAEKGGAGAPSDEISPSEYLAQNVYPILEPGIVELLKVAFPTDFKDFVNRSSVAASQSQEEEKKAKEAEEKEKQENESAEADAEADAPPATPPTPKTPSADRSRPTTKSSKRKVSVVAEEPVQKDKLRPVLWLAQYLKDHNKQNSADREAAKRRNALEVASKPAEDLDTVHENLIAGVKSLLWPCSIYIATTGKIIVQVPKPLDPDEEAAKEEAEGEEDEPAEEAEAQEEGEDGEDAEPKQPEMIDVEISILRYIATSHPDKGIIKDRSLRYEEEGASGKALQSRDPVFVADVSSDPSLKWFPPEPEIRGGSFLAVSLTRTPEDVEPYAVLSVDTMLDRRQLTESEVGDVLGMVRAAESNVHAVPLPPPPPVDEPPNAEGGEEGEEEEGEEEEEEG